MKHGFQHDLSSIEAQMAELEEEQKKLKQIQSDLQVINSNNYGNFILLEGN